MFIKIGLKPVICGKILMEILEKAKEVTHLMDGLAQYFFRFVAKYMIE